MNNNIEQLQVWYEIAMSIGSSLELRPMLNNSLAVLLKKLNCSAGGVLFSRPCSLPSLTSNNVKKIYFEEVFNIPRSIAKNKAYQAAIQRVPKTISSDQLEGFIRQLPSQYPDRYRKLFLYTGTARYWFADTYQIW